MKVFLATLLSLFFLVSCSCGGGTQTFVPTITPAVTQDDGSPSARELRRQLVAGDIERTVSVSLDCSPVEGVKIYGLRSRPSVAMDGRGTGVIVRSKLNRSYIFTAAHVVLADKAYRDAFTCSIYVNRNENLGNKSTRITAEIFAHDERRDIAVLSVEEDLGIATDLELSPFTGEDAFAVGYPVQLASPGTKRLSVTMGTIATLNVPAGNNVSKEGSFHRTTAQLYFGNSGGGIWSIEGKLIGIADALYANDEGVSYEGYYYIKPVGEYLSMLKDQWKYWEVFN